MHPAGGVIERGEALEGGGEGEDRGGGDARARRERFDLLFKLDLGGGAVHQLLHRHRLHLPVHPGVPGVVLPGEGEAFAAVQVAFGIEVAVDELFDLPPADRRLQQLGAVDKKIQPILADHRVAQMLGTAVGVADNVEVGGAHGVPPSASSPAFLPVEKNGRENFGTSQRPCGSSGRTPRAAARRATAHISA